MSNPLTHISTRTTPQSEQADPRQVPNRAGGYVFTVGQMERLRRFLTIGTDSGGYYVNAKELAKENAGVVMELAKTAPLETVQEIVRISDAGRAPKNDAALFALAIVSAMANLEGRQAAYAALPQVARIGTHLLHCVKYREQFTGWSRGLRNAVSAWYLSKSVDDAAFQMVKYRQRQGWAQRDLLRLAHPKPPNEQYSRLFKWATGATGVRIDDIPVIEGFERANSPDTRLSQIPALIRQYPLTWEMLPDAALARTDVWEALLAKGMGMTALIRLLPRLTNAGLLTPTSSWTKHVIEQLLNGEKLRKARIHPISVLIAQRTYALGHSIKGKSTWTPSRPIVDTLDAVFYAAYGNVEPTNKRLLLALDVSGSMGVQAGELGITCRELAAAMALVTANTESLYDIVAFTSSQGARSYHYQSAITPLAISPRQRLDDVNNTILKLSYGGTDCALPMLYATKNKLEVDAFCLFTDNESWAGDIHPHQALREYRQKSGIAAKFIVTAITGTDYTVSDPADPSSLDIAGFDEAVPNLISDFVRGL